jgi:hypothetical protein
MLQFTIDAEGGGVIFGLGLSEENIKNLVDGQPLFSELNGIKPIHISGENKDKILIFAGKTEDEMIGMLGAFITGKTTIIENET